MKHKRDIWEIPTTGYLEKITGNVERTKCYAAKEKISNEEI